MKYIPIVFGIDHNNDIPILFGSFCKFAYYAAKNKWPFVVQKHYLEKIFSFNKDFMDEVYQINEINSIDKKIINNVDFYIIDEEQTKSVINNFKSKEEAWIKLMNKKNNSLYLILDSILNDIFCKYKNIGGFIVWRHNETISQLAKKYGVKVIEMELSGVRKKYYNFGLSYFQFSNKYSNNELEFRYKRFLTEYKKKQDDFPILSRKQILNLILESDKIKQLNTIEEYDVGVALGLKKDFETLSTNSIQNDELLKKIITFEKTENILLRKHPADANYSYDCDFDIDNSNSSLKFVSRCHKIISSVSNINFEAMILGKTCYTLGKMPFSVFSYTDLKYNDDYVINIIDLNFLFFCYYVPYSLCLENEYLDFRMTNPSEFEIYIKHYNYILNNHSIINLKRENNIRSNYLKKCELEEKCKLICEKNIQLENNIREILSSKSWKITKPFRKILKFIRGGSNEK